MELKQNTLLAWQIANFCSISIWEGGKKLPDINKIMNKPSVLDSVEEESDIANEEKLIRILDGIKNKIGDNLITIQDSDIGVED
jgi:hypothetical protein